MKSLHLVIPMAGAGSRFSEKGFNFPKPLIELQGKPFFYWSVMSMMDYVSLQDIIFIILQEHAEKYMIDREILRYFHDAKIISVPEVLPGPVFTCLKGAESITDDLPVMFNDCDHMFRCTQIYSAINSGLDCDGGLLTFEASDPRFSYVRYDNNGNVCGTIEKQAASSSAICGAYVFRNAGIFRDMAGEYVRDCPYSECFMSGIYNIMCSHNMSINTFRVEYNIDFGTPEEYERAKTLPYFKTS